MYLDIYIHVCTRVHLSKMLSIPNDRIKMYQCILQFSQNIQGGLHPHVGVVVRNPQQMVGEIGPRFLG